MDEEYASRHSEAVLNEIEMMTGGRRGRCGTRHCISCRSSSVDRGRRWFGTWNEKRKESGTSVSGVKLVGGWYCT